MLYTHLYSLEAQKGFGESPKTISIQKDLKQWQTIYISFTIFDTHNSVKICDPNSHKYEPHVL